MITLLAALALDAATVRSVVEPKFMDGVHMACEASFDVMVEDTAYNRGELAKVAGSYTFYHWPDGSRLFVGMKMGVSLDGQSYTAPATAYVLNGYRTNRADLQQTLAAEMDGFNLFVFDLGGEETMMSVWNIKFQNRLNVAYTLGDGTMPTTFPVEFSDEASEAWGTCVEALVNRDGSPAN